MKKQIHRETKNGAYFVREPEVAFTKILTSQLDIKHIFNESPDVAKRCLRKKGLGSLHVSGKVCSARDC